MIQAYITKRNAKQITIHFITEIDDLLGDSRIVVSPGQIWEGYSFEELRAINIKVDSQIPLPKVN